MVWATKRSNSGVRDPLGSAGALQRGGPMSHWATRRPADAAPFSNAWLVISIVLFCAVEIFFGGFIYEVVIRRYLSQMFHLKMQVMLNLGSYFIGGVVIGVISPGIRVVEPAVGALASVAMVLMISFFLPYRFITFSFTKLLVGGGIAFLLAYFGARWGEKIMGNIPGDA